MYEWTEENLGELASRFTRHGLAGAFNVNFKGSIQMNNPFPTNLEELGGAPLSVMTDLWESAKHLHYGEYYKGLEKALPTAIGTPVKGLRLYNEGLNVLTSYSEEGGFIMVHYRYGTYLVIFLIIMAVGCGSSETRKTKFFEKGTEFYEQGDYAKAILNFQNAIKLDPNYADAYSSLGTCYLKVMNIQGAFKAFSKASR